MLKIKISYKWLPFQETVQALLINQFDPMLQFLFTSYGKQKKWISKPLPSHKESAVLRSPSPCFDVWCGYWYWLLGFGQQCRLHLEFMERTPIENAPLAFTLDIPVEFLFLRVHFLLLFFTTFCLSCHVWPKHFTKAMSMSLCYALSRTKWKWTNSESRTYFSPPFFFLPQTHHILILHNRVEISHDWK